MPCIWLKHNNSQVFMDVAITSTKTVEEAKKGNYDTLDTKRYKALVDTGAQGTCITKRVADELGLKPSGKMPVVGVSGKSYHNYYLFHVGFIITYSGKTKSGQDAIETNLNINNRIIAGAELIVPDSGFDVLLGMDILSVGSLAIEGNGTFSFSF